MTNQQLIRNFAIIAHVDHGKSTLADRMLELTGTVSKAEKQTLDSNPIERERGITIKLAPVRMEYNLDIVKSKNEKVKTEESATHLYDKLETYILNLIDTPGHVDFAYEVSRALAACEGAILLVDATQGIQAQTLAHFREAKRLDLKLIPVVNKVDLDSAEVIETKLQLMETFGFEEGEILDVSGKTGQGVKELLEAVVEKIPAPEGRAEDLLRALVFNSHYDEHQGVVAWIRVIDGELKKGDRVFLLGNKEESQIIETGYFDISDKRKVKSEKTNILSTGEAGYAVLSLKDPQKIQIGDTLTLKGAKEIEPLPGYNPPKPMVFVSLYPMDQSEYQDLGEALDKLRLLDSSLDVTPESSPMLGNGYRVGFLGVLHAEIVQERLVREFEIEVMGTQPSVVYRIKSNIKNQVSNNENSEDRIQKTEYEIHSPQELPDPSMYDEILEPILDVWVFTPHEYVNELVKLFQKHRGQLIDTKAVGSQIHLNFVFPLAELVGEFYSAFKSVSSGFASLDYQLAGYEEADLVKMDILLAGEEIGALSRIVPKEQTQGIGRKIVDKLCEVIPRHNFEISVQAAIGGKILARGNIKPFRKDVTAKLYGGDQTRKDKLLKKQKKGKKRMKEFGRVSLPADTFWKILR
jgi:GTP-binding protein LepA